MNNDLINDYKALELLELDYNKIFELQLSKKISLKELYNKRELYKEYIHLLEEKYNIEFTPFYKDKNAKYYDTSGLYSYCDAFKRKILKEEI